MNKQQLEQLENLVKQLGFEILTIKQNSEASYEKSILHTEAGNPEYKGEIEVRFRVLIKYQP